MASETKSTAIQKSLFGFCAQFSDAVEPMQPYFGHRVVTKRRTLLELQSRAQGHLSSLSAVWSPNNDFWENRFIQFFWLVVRKTIDSSQEVWFTEGIDRAGNRALKLILLLLLLFFVYLFAFKFSLLNCPSMREKTSNQSRCLLQKN